MFSFSIYRFLEKKTESKYISEKLLDTLKTINFAEVQEQGFIPLHEREPITDALHEACGFRTDYQFRYKVKERNKLLYSVTTTKIAASQKIQGIQRFFC